jgi:PhnB protein
MNKVKPIPEGASVIIPRLVCREPVEMIEFCKTVFDAVEQVRRPGPDGSVAHALVTIGPAMLMIEGEWPAITCRAPKTDGSSPVIIFVYTENVDAAVERAIAKGATILMPAKDQFWGDRTAWIMDPSGHVWTIATRVEEPTEKERQSRLEQLFSETQKQV